MKKVKIDVRLIAGLLVAHLLMYFTFQDNAIFWYIFSATLLFMISFAIFNEEIEDKASFSAYISIGVFTGLVLFSIFWIGNTLIEVLNLPFASQISKLYGSYSPSLLWHYIALLLIIIPGEEIFWRGFVQKRILRYTNIAPGVIISSVLYASVHLYSGQWMLAFAALIAGLFWGFLYAWKKSIPLVIVSHLVFDLLLFIILPFG